MLNIRGYRNEKKWNQELKLFFEQEHLEVPNEERKRQSLELLRLERKKMRLMPACSYGRRVLNQASYISPLTWVVQGLLVLCLGLLLGEMRGEQEELLVVLSGFAPVMGIVGCTEALRSYRENVWELEQACRYNLRQLMGMRLLIFGAVDAAIAVLVFLSSVPLGIPVRELLLFFLVPQLLSDSVYLYLMTRFRRRLGGAAVVAAGVGMVLLIWLWGLDLLYTKPGLLQMVLNSARVEMMVVASAGLLAVCCVRFLKGMEKEEEGWNFGWID